MLVPAMDPDKRSSRKIKSSLLRKPLEIRTVALVIASSQASASVRTRFSAMSARVVVNLGNWLDSTKPMDDDKPDSVGGSFTASTSRLRVALARPASGKLESLT